MAYDSGVIPSHLIYGYGPEAEPVPRLHEQPQEAYLIHYGRICFYGVGEVEKLTHEAWQQMLDTDNFDDPQQILELPVIESTRLASQSATGIIYHTETARTRSTDDYEAPVTPRPISKTGQTPLFVSWGACIGRNTPPPLRPNPEIVGE